MNLSTLFFIKSRPKDSDPGLKTGVKINFYPFRPQMAREIEQCVASGRIDTMLSFCNCCIFNISLKRSEPECNACYINHGIEKTIRLQKRKTERASSLVTRFMP